MIIALDGLSGATTAGRLELVGVVGRGLGVFEGKKSGVEVRTVVHFGPSHPP